MPKTSIPFIRICPRFTLIFEDKLYRDSPPHLRDRIIIWAAQGGFAGTIRKCLRAGSKICYDETKIQSLMRIAMPRRLNVHGAQSPHPAVAAEAGSLSYVKHLAKGVNANLDEDTTRPQ